MIASLTMANPPEAGAADTPFSQIAIELYSPVSGGLSIGGRFSPDALHVLGIVLDYSVGTAEHATAPE